MSDQGEYPQRFTAHGGDTRRDESTETQTGFLPQVGDAAADVAGASQPGEGAFGTMSAGPQRAFTGRLTFSDEPEGSDGFPGAATAPGGSPWGTDRTGAGTPEWPQAAGVQPFRDQVGGQFSAPESRADTRTEPHPGFGGPAEPEEAASPFDGFDAGEGDNNYAGVDMSGPAGPVKAGVPSSGNWRMPEWMREEAGEGPGGGFNPPGVGERGGGKGKIVLFVVLGLVVLALLAGAALFFLKSPAGKSDTKPSPSAPAPAPSDSASQGTQPEPGAATPLPNATLQKFPGTHTKAAGRIDDTFAGLSYPRLGSPWQVPSKKSGLAQPGWSSQQIVVTEKHGNQIWYGQLMTGVLGPAEQSIYPGPGSEQQAAIAYEQGVETRLYGFPHKSHAVASQALDLPDTHAKGWLVGYELSYHRDGIKATGEIVTVAIINTGKKSPAVLFMSVPNTEKKLLPDINFVIESVKGMR